jgi:multiple sugar transport system ATP-binding protein
VAQVVLDHVSKAFGDLTAVNDLSLEVRDREFLVLVGPSGCGKTTALRMIVGLEDATEGDIYIGDRRVNDLPPKARDIAMVFQSYALYPHMSVFDNMGFALKLRRVNRTEIEQRVRHAARILGIENLLARKPRQLSGGQRQRVALGRAIVREPQVFLMDEPLSNLDAKLRVQMRAELIKLHQRLQATVIYVTHDQVEAMTMGTRIAVMHDGVLQQLDTPENVYQHPANTFVAGFIGSPSMNFFNGHLVRDDDGQLFVQGAGLRLPVPAWRMPNVAGHGDRSVIFGVRPESVSDPRQIRGETMTRARATVSVVEPLGPEVLVYLQTNGTEFVSRMDARFRPVPDETVEVAFDLDQIHLFDPDTQQALG